MDIGSQFPRKKCFDRTLFFATSGRGRDNHHECRQETTCPVHSSILWWSSRSLRPASRDAQRRSTACHDSLCNQAEESCLGTRKRRRSRFSEAAKGTFARRFCTSSHSSGSPLPARNGTANGVNSRLRLQAERDHASSRVGARPLVVIGRVDWGLWLQKKAAHHSNVCPG